MKRWIAAHRRARVIALVTAGLVVGLLLLAFVLVSVDRIADDPDAGTAAPSPSPSQPSVPDESKADNRPAAPLEAALPDTDDPDAYAAAIANVLFGMDYGDHKPSDYESLLTNALWPEIAPEDRSRLMATMSKRIPTPNVWEQMRSVDQRATFKVELVWEPRSGKQGRIEGWWPDGVVLRNVSGTQTETWRSPGGQTGRSTREVAVTVGVACPPAASPCRLVSIQPNVES